MNIAQIENNLQILVKSFDEHSFIYELLLAYGQPKASIKRLQEGGLNLIVFALQTYLLYQSLLLTQIDSYQYYIDSTLGRIEGC